MFSFIDTVCKKFWLSKSTPANNSDTPFPSDELDIPFSSRLKEIEYELLLVPEFFNCPITLSIMENPYIVNHHDSHVFDKEVLDKWLLQVPDEDPLRAKIGIIKENQVEKPDIKPHIKRKNQIEEFVSSLEQIHALNKKLNNLEKTTVDILEDAFLQLDIEHQHREQLLKEQREQQENQKKDILQIKLSLYLELDTFIKNTTKVIREEIKQEKEKHEEIERITGEKQDQLQLLEKELKPVFPHLFSHQVNNQNGNNVQLYFPSNSLFLRQLLPYEKKQPLWQSTFFYSPINAFNAPAMTFFAYLYILALNHRPELNHLLNKNQVSINQLSLLE